MQTAPPGSGSRSPTTLTRSPQSTATKSTLSRSSVGRANTFRSVSCDASVVNRPSSPPPQPPQNKKEVIMISLNSFHRINVFSQNGKDLVSVKKLNNLMNRCI